MNNEEVYVLLMDGKVVYRGTKKVAEKRYDNAMYNKKEYLLREEYSLMTEKEYMNGDK